MPAVQSPDTAATTAHLPYLVHAIRHAKHWVDQVKAWATWEQPQNAVLALAFWCLLCLHFWTVVIYILPLIPLLWAMQRWPTTTTTSDKDDKRITIPEQTPLSLTVMDAIGGLENAIETAVETLCWEKHPAKTKRVFLMLVYAYVCWVAAHQLVDTCHILMAAGMLALTWRSPWMIKARTSARYPLSILAAVFLGSANDASATSSLAHNILLHQDSVMRRAAASPDFVFVLLENQRYLGQWQSPSLPFDFAPWTDEAGHPVLAKSKFLLPEPLVQTLSADAEHRKTWTWHWVDADWRLDDNDSAGTRDELGWEYGSMVWTMFDRASKGWLSTRRRRWIRRATIEHRVEVTNIKLSTASSPSSPMPAPATTTTTTTTTTTAAAATASAPSTFSSSPIQSPTSQSFYVDSVSSPPVSPRTSTASIFRHEGVRRDTFGIPRMSQSTITVSHDSTAYMSRSRSTSLYSSPQGADNNTATSLASASDSVKRISREPSKKRREAVWKSIVRT